MATYVILDGATGGGWNLRDLAACLRTAGHEVYTPTLTGLGERSHLLSRDIDLDTHIQDILGVLRYEDLYEVILIGGSYSGMVISGVAEKMPERLQHLVYLDAIVPKDGLSALDLLPSELAAEVEARVNEHGDGWLFPADKSLEVRRTDHPFKTIIQPLDINNLDAVRLRRTYISCTKEPADSLAAIWMTPGAQRAKAEGWGYYDLQITHDTIFDNSEVLSQLLLKLA